MYTNCILYGYYLGTTVSNILTTLAANGLICSRILLGILIELSWIWELLLALKVGEGRSRHPPVWIFEVWGRYGVSMALRYAYNRPYRHTMAPFTPRSTSRGARST
jgi:hypothetical protein